MTDISFYHLERSPLEQALPKLLEKTLAAGKRALVLASSDERVEALAQTLWTYDPGSWLPHGTPKDGNPEDQPVWLSTDPETPNHAMPVVSDPTVQAARDRWKAYKAAGHDLTYLQQTAQGGWEKKA